MRTTIEHPVLYTLLFSPASVLRLFPVRSPDMHCFCPLTHAPVNLNVTVLVTRGHRWNAEHMVLGNSCNRTTWDACIEQVSSAVVSGKYANHSQQQARRYQCAAKHSEGQPPLLIPERQHSRENKSDCGAHGAAHKPHNLQKQQRMHNKGLHRDLPPPCQ